MSQSTTELLSRTFFSFILSSPLQQGKKSQTQTQNQNPQTLINTKQPNPINHLFKTFKKTPTFHSSSLFCFHLFFMMEIATTFPGFRFSPTDQELVSHYLKRKIEGLEKSGEVIAEVDICKYEPWDLPAKSVIQSDYEWFFFSPSGKKYPNGAQARRATEVGFWKATGKERTIKSGSRVIGTKRTLVFHIGRAPKGERTDWIMHEYCIKGNTVNKTQETFVICRIRKKLEFTGITDSPDPESNSHKDTSSTNITLDGASQVGTDLQQSQIGVDGKGKASGSECGSFSKQLNQDGNVKPVEDDCFAEILMDDIIKLDDIPWSLPGVSEKPETKSKLTQPAQQICSFISRVNPFQGTAERRIRLETSISRHNQGEVSGANDKGSVPDGFQKNDGNKQPRKSLKTGESSYCVANSWMVRFGLIIVVVLLASYLKGLGGAWQFKC